MTTKCLFEEAGQAFYDGTDIIDVDYVEVHEPWMANHPEIFAVIL